MKKKGFTLIELLAVIVILAVIALILVPLVSNIVDNARKETAKRSVENYILAANNAGAISLVDKNRGIDIKEDYYIFETGETDAELLKIDIKGERPKYAYLEFDVNNKTVKEAKVCFGKYNFNYANGVVTSTTVDYCAGAKGYDATQLSYTNESSTNNCDNVACALDELYEKLH